MLLNPDQDVNNAHCEHVASAELSPVLSRELTFSFLFATRGTHLHPCSATRDHTPRPAPKAPPVHTRDTPLDSTTIQRRSHTHVRATGSRRDTARASACTPYGLLRAPTLGFPRASSSALVPAPVLTAAPPSPHVPCSAHCSRPFCSPADGHPSAPARAHPFTSTAATPQGARPALSRAARAPCNLSATTHPHRPPPPRPTMTAHTRQR